MRNLPLASRFHAIALLLLVGACSNSFNREAAITVEPISVEPDVRTSITVAFDREVFVFWDVAEVYLATATQDRGEVAMEDAVGAASLREFGDVDLMEANFSGRENALLDMSVPRTPPTDRVVADVRIPAEYAGTTLFLVASTTYFDVHGTQRWYGVSEIQVRP